MPLPIVIFALSLAAIVLYAAFMLAKDAAAMLLRAAGLLPSLPVYGAARSGKWPTLEKKWLALHPTCAACGAGENVSVHHKRPFHLHPELELEPSNLITLCEKHCCHLMIGHNGDWHAFNPHVEEDSRFLNKRIAQRKYE